MGRLNFAAGGRLGALVGAFVLAALTGALPARAAVAGVSGRVVRNDAAVTPVVSATVYAYQVVEHTFRKVSTDDSGRFLFEELPAGLYKIVALKLGLPPAVLMLTRRAADESQFVEVSLDGPDKSSASDFWSLRGEVPSDVLRDIVPTLATAPSAVTAQSQFPKFVGEVSAATGSDLLDQNRTAGYSGAELAMRGALGAVGVEVRGEFQRLGSRLGQPDFTQSLGESTAVHVGVDAATAGEFGFTGESHRLGADTVGGDEHDFSRLQFQYARDIGSNGTTTIQARYLDETGLFRRNVLAPVELPSGSRLLTLQGGYAGSIDGVGSIRAGLRYREADRDLFLAPANAGPAKYLDLWSQGNVELNPVYLVEYGLLSTMHDGSVSFVPKGGVVLHFLPEWSASMAASHRLVTSSENPLADDFASALLKGALGCENSEATCYEAQVAHREGEDGQLHVRSSWREFDRTVRLFLQEDFFAGGDGLFFVPGDRLPEVGASYQRRLGHAVLANWSASWADGGGGVFRAANRHYYENEVGYLTTSIDAHIEPTATGIYLSFHRIEQRLDPLAERARRGLKPATVSLERVELVVSQDLSELFDLTSSWAVRVGMELVRGDSLLTPITEGDGTRRRLTTGVAVRF